MRKIIILCILTTLLLVSCKPAEEAPEEPTPPPVPEMMPEEAAEEPVIKETLSELRCVDDRIEAVISNTNTKTLEIAKDIKVMVNGLLVVDPECDSLTLEPGQSTFCQDISGHLAIRKGKTNTIKLNLLHENIVEYVQCFVEPEEEIEEEEEPEE